MQHFYMHNVSIAEAPGPVNGCIAARLQRMG